MEPDTSSLTPGSNPAKSGWQLGAQWLVVTAILFTWSVGRIPFPGVNEPHYLAKARHYWDPQWCAAPSVPGSPITGDVFLDSANPHEFFYRTFGVLTRWLPLESSAWWGRLAGYALVAWGWVALCQTLMTTDDSSPRSSWVPLLASLGLFLLLQSAGSWSGEWLVGGIESKVPAYGLFFWGLSKLLRGEWFRAAVGYGLSISFHPLIGGWGLIAAAWVLLGERGQRRPTGPTQIQFAGACAMGALTAFPGLWPALQVLVHADPGQARFADYLMVAHRLKHHLDPGSFPVANWQFFLFALGTWGLLRLAAPATGVRQRWERVVLASVAIAAVGVAVAAVRRPLQMGGLGDWQIKFLKFYPFRLPDVLVLVALSFAVCEFLQRHPPDWWQRCSLRVRQVSTWLVIGGMLYGSVLIPGSDRNPSGMSSEQLNDWVACCHWLRDQTPRDVVVYATNERWAIKWYAERSEYVNYKDCPQNAAHLAEWNARQWVIAKWREAAFQDWRVTKAELAELKRQTGITHLLSSRFGPVQQAPVFQQGEFEIYELP